MLTGPQIGKLRDAIRSAFNLQALEQFLFIRLDKKLDDFAPGAGMPFQVFRLLQDANMEGWHEELINALLAERPKSSAILDIAFDLGISLHLEDAKSQLTINRSGLQAFVNADPSFDPSAILQGISANKRCVCRIQLQNGHTSYGTGFLVGPGMLLSNYHVFKEVIKDPSLSSKVRCRFDYETTATGKNINAGTEIGLDNNTPIMAYSEFTNYDELGIPGIDDVDWPVDKLDYALVKLERDIGNEPFGPNNQNATSEARGWIKPAIPAPIFPGSHMIIIQHPDMQPVKISFGLSRVKGCDKKEVRVRYEINTMNGSSGSPCFDHKFNWIALHNMGDPSFNPAYNQGIPAVKIIADLATKQINLQ